MADTTPTELLGLPGPLPAEPADVPRVISSRPSAADRAFRGLLRFGGITVFAIIGLIGGFLIARAWGVFSKAGWSFLTTET